MGAHTFYVYLLSNERRTVLYTGVTNDLARRLGEHRQGTADAFTTRYRTTDLVWFESHGSIVKAIAREKRIKRWKRFWKWDLVRTMNPELQELSGELIHLR